MADDKDLQERYEEELDDFKHLLRINKHKLDDEIQEHSDMYYRVSEKAAETASYRDAAKQRIAVVEAETSQNFRLHGIEDIGRVTDATVKEATLQNPEVKKATRNFIIWKRIADEWDAMRSAVDQRGRMLRDLTQLFVSGYFTVTAAGRATDNQREANVSRARALMAEQRKPLNRPRLKDSNNAED